MSPFGSRALACRSKLSKGVLPGANITCTLARNHCLKSSCDNRCTAENLISHDAGPQHLWHNTTERAYGWFQREQIDSTPSFPNNLTSFRTMWEICLHENNLLTTTELVTNQLCKRKAVTSAVFLPLSWAEACVHRSVLSECRCPWRPTRAASRAAAAGAPRCTPCPRPPGWSSTDRAGTPTPPTQADANVTTVTGGTSVKCI